MIGRFGFIGVFLAASCQPAPAQPHPEMRFYTTSQDEASLEEVTSGEEYRLEYHNSASHSSREHPVYADYEGFRVDIVVILGAGPETVEPRPPAGWISIPFSMEIEDGSTGVFKIIPEQEWQGI